MSIPIDEARAAYAADPAPDGLPAARIMVEPLGHHGAPLRFTGTKRVGDLAEHRFACADRSCPFRVTISVMGV